MIKTIFNIEIFHKIFVRLIAFLAVLAISFPAFAEAKSLPIISYPPQIDKTCRKGKAKLYDECSDQLALFNKALRRANKEKKVLLVSYGAEWCIWCHVCDKHLQGEITSFKYKVAARSDRERGYQVTLWEREKRNVKAEAVALNKFASKSFVLVHIDSKYADNGLAVLKKTGALKRYQGGLPYIFTVNSAGQFSERHWHDRNAIRRDTWDWYRGYNRRALLDELKKMYKSAVE